MKKYLVIVTILLLIMPVLASHFLEYNFYADKVYPVGNEHIDVKIKGMAFSIDHFVIGKNDEVLLSEHISGFHLKLFGESHYLFPIKAVNIFTNKNLTGALTPLGILSVCIFKSDENIVAFFDINRGMTMIDDKKIHLSSLFLGVNGKHVCPHSY